MPKPQNKAFRMTCSLLLILISSFFIATLAQAAKAGQGPCEVDWKNCVQTNCASKHETYRYDLLAQGSSDKVSQDVKALDLCKSNCQDSYNRCKSMQTHGS